VPEYCTCGAQLPPDARFCHKCAKPQYDYPGLEDAESALPPPLPVAVPPPLPVALPPAEISFRNRIAVKIGFLAALLALGATMLITPVVQSGIVGMLVTFGAGVLAPLWYTRRTGQQLSVRSGARIGWITGLFCFGFSLVLFTLGIVALTNANSIPGLQDNPTMKKAVQDLLKILNDPAQAVQGIIIVVVSMFLFITTLPMLGGALGARLSHKQP
jgi:uncharacterized protein YqgC (DUF456 family)